MSLLRTRNDDRTRVTSVELFFDLVFASMLVVAITEVLWLLHRFPTRRIPRAE